MSNTPRVGDTQIANQRARKLRVINGSIPVDKRPGRRQLFLAFSKSRLTFMRVPSDMMPARPAAAHPFTQPLSITVMPPCCMYDAVGGVGHVLPIGTHLR